ncbi:CMRF35-like molecule 1 isoform X2 [Mugil cephalus]|uniref:CMRF35-like molecule 1 isoform X2 n=1 Tax=Mugil cephalus TaxID=48193 RepID=UPI001FB67CA0|nr:CMRF35-like molecule 1 isoform X2 [Mugil cephalus]
MRTSGTSVGFFNAPVFCLLWLTRLTVASAQLSGPGVVTAVDGGSVTISCQYDPLFKENTKYWCRGFVYEFCKIIVKTPKDRNDKRSSIIDNKEAGFFNVTMTLLGESDVDTYWCVIARHGRNVFTSVQLLISHAVTTEPLTTEVNSLLITQEDPVSLWGILRWILFILMLCCFAATHVAVRRMKPEKM